MFHRCRGLGQVASPDSKLLPSGGGEFEEEESPLSLLPAETSHFYFFGVSETRATSRSSLRSHSSPWSFSRAA